MSKLRSFSSVETLYNSPIPSEERERERERERESIARAKKDVERKIAKIYKKIFKRVSESLLVGEKKDFVLTHCYRLLRKALFCYGEVPQELDPFAYLDSIGC